jgi:hypothetical protein
MTFLTITLAALAFTATPDCSPIKGPLAGRSSPMPISTAWPRVVGKPEAEAEKAPPPNLRV